MRIHEIFSNKNIINFLLPYPNINSILVLIFSVRWEQLSCMVVFFLFIFITLLVYYRNKQYRTVEVYLHLKILKTTKIVFQVVFQSTKLQKFEVDITSKTNSPFRVRVDMFKNTGSIFKAKQSPRFRILKCLTLSCRIILSTISCLPKKVNKHSSMPTKIHFRFSYRSTGCALTKEEVVR